MRTSAGQVERRPFQIEAENIQWPMGLPLSDRKLKPYVWLDTSSIGLAATGASLAATRRTPPTPLKLYCFCLALPLPRARNQLTPAPIGSSGKHCPNSLSSRLVGSGGGQTWLPVAPKLPAKKLGRVPVDASTRLIVGRWALVVAARTGNLTFVPEVRSRYSAGGRRRR